MSAGKWSANATASSNDPQAIGEADLGVASGRESGAKTLVGSG